MFLSGLLRDVVDFCYPGACAACGSFCDGDSILCEDCDSDLDRLEGGPACALCGAPLAERGSPCAYCHGVGIAHYDRVLRLGKFDEPLRGLIHQIKYQGRWGLAERLTDRLLQQEDLKGLLTQTQVLVPVPLHPLRQFWRGFNQAEVIARVLGNRCRIPIARPLARIRHTPTQTHLHSRAKRFANLQDAFALKRTGGVQDRHVVVIDDVMTTGATLQTIARALKAAKPASLSAVLLAVADPRGRDFQAV